MLKKLLFVTVLLLLVSVQMLTVNCDLRCSLMRDSAGSHAVHADMPMPYCHGMSMEQDNQAGLTVSHSCASTGCGTQLKMAVKSGDWNDAGSSKLLVSAVVLLAGSFGDTHSNSATGGWSSLSRSSDDRPLVQRPGTSLRI